MAESIVQVTEGSGKKLHTWNRTIGANSIEDEFVVLGEFPYATYTVSSAQVLTTTANSHMLQIMAGSTLPVRIRRIMITQGAAAAGIGVGTLQLFRLTTAGTGGTAITPRPLDSADAASGATAMTLPTAKGTEGVMLYERGYWLSTAALFPPNFPLYWEQSPAEKPIIIPAGTTNGIAIKNTVGTATSTLIIEVDLVETNFV